MAGQAGHWWDVPRKVRHENHATGILGVSRKGVISQQRRHRPFSKISNQDIHRRRGHFTTAIIHLYLDLINAFTRGGGPDDLIPRTIYCSGICSPGKQ